jgi:hypothetical protein
MSNTTSMPNPTSSQPQQQFLGATAENPPPTAAAPGPHAGAQAPFSAARNGPAPVPLRMQDFQVRTKKRMYSTNKSSMETVA